MSIAALFLLVFLWQFPHFMAIAWLYRHEYAKAGMQMLPVVDPSGIRAGAQAVLAAAAILPTSMLAAMYVPPVQQWYFVIAGLLSIAFGVVLAARPGMGAVSLAVIYGIFSLAFGISQVVLGVQARRIGLTTPDSLAHA